MILKKFKDIYNNAEAITCVGCRGEFKPVTFKCHLERCPLLEREEIEEPASQDDGKISVRVNKVQSDGSIKFAIQHQGIAWVCDPVDFADVQYVAKNLKKEFPNLSAFIKGSFFESFMAL